MATDDTQKTPKKNSAKRKQVADVHSQPDGKVDRSASQSSQQGSTEKQVIQNSVHPSVTGAIEDPSNDSMFNQADPQSADVLRKEAEADERSSNQDVAGKTGNRDQKIA